MQAIRSQNTKIEIKLGKALWAKGYRYRKNDKTVLGKPDFTIKRSKLAIFCDSEFWHGKDWETQQKRIATNSKFWITKIQRNIERDKLVKEQLIKDGWTVLRFWESEIKKNIDQCIIQIEYAINLLK